MLKRYSLYLIVLPLLIQSCVSHEQLVYMQDTHVKYDTLVSYTPGPLFDYKIRPHDQLAIRINSYSDNTAVWLNSEVSGGGGGNRVDMASLYMSSYLVSDSGFIQMPLLGKVKVTGITTQALKDTLDRRLRPYLSRATANVKLTTFPVTVLGEVKTPGTQYIFNTRTSLLQVLGMSGDLTDFAERKRVKFIRDTEQGLKVTYLDLTSPAFLSSEFFFVRPNDIIYIEPMKAKSVSLNQRNISIGLSLVSLATTVVNLIIVSRNNAN
ncbi:MAG: polysaccharide biosynthesis/export family protein [Bacteroidia bacterium]|nr:polysaccharide biosynthesis/export family protein [Bacteroidia bacterium]